jgi:N-succinyl-L-ornithine transcarbamylase
MKNFTSVHDIQDPVSLAEEAIALKHDSFSSIDLGKNKTLGLIFFNPSLRTRISTQIAAMNLGMRVIVMNVDKETWALEFNDGTVMNSSTAEHIHDAAGVMGMYCDIIGVRSFPSLNNREEDYNERILLKFMKHSRVPVISLESATRHPLQSLADLMTIMEHWREARKPKVVLTWAPHVKAIPQVVANSFLEWMKCSGVNLCLAHPEGYELHEDFTRNVPVFYDQQEALDGADFIYVKNWSSFNDYGKVLPVTADWLLSEKKLTSAPDASIMHCLPVRRNLELTDELIEGRRSLVMKQAENRVFAAQAVLKRMLSNMGVTPKSYRYEKAASN